MEIPYDPSIAHLSMRPKNILHHSDPSNPYISYLTLSEFYVARSERCQRKKLTIQALVTLVWFQWALNITNKREFGGSWRPFPSAISYWGKFLNIRVWICHIVSVTLSSTCATDSPVSDAIWLMSITSRNCGKAQNQMEKRAEWHNGNWCFSPPNRQSISLNRYGQRRCNKGTISPKASPNTLTPDPHRHKGKL